MQNVDKLVMTLKNWPNDARIGYLFITRAMKNFLIIKARILDDYENELLEVGLFYNVAQYWIVCSYCLVGGLVTCYSLTMVIWWINFLDDHMLEPQRVLEVVLAFLSIPSCRGLLKLSNLHHHRNQCLCRL